jgi:hypothetical protein
MSFNKAVSAAEVDEKIIMNGVGKDFIGIGRGLFQVSAYKTYMKG